MLFCLNIYILPFQLAFLLSQRRSKNAEIELAGDCGVHLGSAHFGELCRELRKWMETFEGLAPFYFHQPVVIHLSIDPMLFYQQLTQQQWSQKGTGRGGGGKLIKKLRTERRLWMFQSCVLMRLCSNFHIQEPLTECGISAEASEGGKEGKGGGNPS